MLVDSRLTGVYIGSEVLQVQADLSQQIADLEWDFGVATQTAIESRQISGRPNETFHQFFIFVTSACYRAVVYQHAKEMLP